jgi:hypothetical protein
MEVASIAFTRRRMRHGPPGFVTSLQAWSLAWATLVIVAQSRARASAVLVVADIVTASAAATAAAVILMSRQ